MGFTPKKIINKIATMKLGKETPNVAKNVMNPLTHFFFVNAPTIPSVIPATTEITNAHAPNLAVTGALFRMMSNTSSPFFEILSPKSMCNKLTMYVMYCWNKGLSRLYFACIAAYCSGVRFLLSAPNGLPGIACIKKNVIVARMNRVNIPMARRFKIYYPM